MDPLQWRGKARVVAYLDLIIQGIALLGVIYLVILAGFLTSAAITDSPELMEDVSNHLDAVWETGKIDPETVPTLVWIMWIVVAVSAIATFIQWWAAVKLMHATDVGRQFHDALKKAATWRKVTIVFLVFQSSGLLRRGMYIGKVIGIVIRCVFLYIVHKFMSEVDTRFTTSSFPIPMVTVKN